MKNGILIMASMLSFSIAQAQGVPEGAVRMAMPQGPRQGLTANLLFTVVSETETTMTYGNGQSISSSSPAKAGVAGVRLSYMANTFSPSFGFEPGLSYQRRLGENDGREFGLATLDLNFIVRSTSGLSVYFGPAVSQTDSKNSSVTHRIAPGAQGGFGYQSGGLTMRLGYVRYGTRLEGTDFDGREFETTGHMAGFSSQLGYIF